MPCLLFYENAEFIAKSTNLALTNLVPATPVVITKEFLFSLKACVATILLLHRA
jgi:hypothetical protein